MINVKKFLMFLLIVSITSIYSLFYFYYQIKIQETSKIILENINNDINEFSYILKNREESDINSFRSLIDRKVLINKNIKKIFIYYKDKNILSTIPEGKINNKKFVNNLYIQNANFNNILKYDDGLYKNISFYNNGKKQKYTIYYEFNKENINKSINMHNYDFIFLFIIFPTFLLIIFLYLIQLFFLKPLKFLKNYNYEKNKDLNFQCIIEEFLIIKNSIDNNMISLKKEKEEIDRINKTDSLSGVANKTYLEEKFKIILGDSKKNNKNFALLFLDLDNFKNINDSLGHGIGDEILKIIANDINSNLRQNDIVARIGGDEFIIIVSEYINENYLLEIVKRIQNRIREEKIVSNFTLNVDSSIGISIYPYDGTDLLSLMKNADIALHKSKEEGKSQYNFFTEELNKKTQNYIEINNNMKKALEDNHYKLFYQPQIDVKSGKIIGAEALIRWIDPIKGIIPPNDFIPVAEINGFIKEIGKWVIEESIKHKKILEDLGYNIYISLNVAPVQMKDFSFFEHIEKQILDNGVNPKEIILEITESIFMKNNENLKLILNSLKDFGIQMALDDFGTGYSSISYLKEFQMDKLKIDKSFMDEFNTENGLMFLETIIKMADILKLEVVAEGIESKEQLELLKQLECETYQGYYYSKPIPFDDFIIILNNEKF